MDEAVKRRSRRLIADVLSTRFEAEENARQLFAEIEGSCPDCFESAGHFI